jgi:hypothetical protein
MRKFLVIGCLLLTVFAQAQRGKGRRSVAELVAETVMKTWKDSFALDGKAAKWTYDMGVILKGFEGIWLNTGDVKYYNYIQQQMDFFVKDDGTIKTYKQEEYNIDNVNNGKLLLLLYRVTLKDKYPNYAITQEQMKVDSGIRRSIPAKCGWMVYTWVSLSMLNMQCLPMRTLPSMILPTSLSGWKNMQEMQRLVYYIMHGMKANK